MLILKVCYNKPKWLDIGWVNKGIQEYGKLTRQEAAAMLTRVYKAVKLPGWTLATEIILNIDNASNIDNSQIKTEQLADMGKQITACQKEKQILCEQLLTVKIMLIDKVYVYPDNRIEIERKIKDFCTDTMIMLS